MRPADSWRDYELLDATNHNRLERWGQTLLIRPDPWQQSFVQGTFRVPDWRRIWLNET